MTETTPKRDFSSAPAHWRQETDADGIVWLCIDKAEASANVLSGEVLWQLDAILDEWVAKPPTGLVVYSGKQNGFIMGADINEFVHLESAEQAFEAMRLGQQVLAKLEGLQCPSVAAINGFALGGGLELAMACHYRLALENEKPVLGLPEVQLGLHPGFGGTVRAVAIAGVRQAMQMMLTGKPITVAKGLRIGLIDRIARSDQWRDAAREIIAAHKPRVSAPLADRLLGSALARPFVAKMLRRQVAARARKEHYPAPYAMIDLWSRVGASPSTGYVAEAHSMAELMVGATSRNLVRVFFLQNRLKSQGKKPPRKVARVHIVGAGVMGGDIAAWCALRGLDVTLQDRATEYIEPALQRADKLFSKKIRDPNKLVAATSRLHADVAGDGVADADLIIEAIFEDQAAKTTLYEKIEETMRSDAVLATNTSSIRLEDLRGGLRQPDRFIGLHFFNPVAQLPLVEVIRCADTNPGVLDTGFAFVKDIGKLPLECTSAPGFVVNRILSPYMAEALHLAESGVALAAIDQAAEDFGMPMGPIELSDSVGLDVVMQVSKILGAAFGRPVPARISEMVANKTLGRKSGQGFYTWQDGKAIKSERDRSGSLPAPDDIQDRLIFPMVNEAIACLSERVVSDADYLDAGVIFGTGFAPFRGGPLQYSRDRGPEEIVRGLQNFAGQFGDRYRPHEGWEDFS